MSYSSLFHCRCIYLFILWDKRGKMLNIYMYVYGPLHDLRAFLLRVQTDSFLVRSTSQVFTADFNGMQPFLFHKVNWCNTIFKNPDLHSVHFSVCNTFNTNCMLWICIYSFFHHCIDWFVYICLYSLSVGLSVSLIEKSLPTTNACLRRHTRMRGIRSAHIYLQRRRT